VIGALIVGVLAGGSLALVRSRSLSGGAYYALLLIRSGLIGAVFALTFATPTGWAGLLGLLPGLIVAVARRPRRRQGPLLDVGLSPERAIEAEILIKRVRAEADGRAGEDKVLLDFFGDVFAGKATPMANLAHVEEGDEEELEPVAWLSTSWRGGAMSARKAGV
jgi:hypothetical protein